MPNVGGVAGARLKSFIERVERLHEERDALAEDLKEVYAEARGSFDVKVMKKLVAIRRKDQDALDEEETLLDVYKRALGMIPDLPSDEPVPAGARVPEKPAAVKPSEAVAAAKRLARGGGVSLEMPAGSPLNDAIASTLKDAGFVETGPGHFRAPAPESAEPF